MAPAMNVNANPGTETTGGPAAAQDRGQAGGSGTYQEPLLDPTRERRRCRKTDDRKRLGVCRPTGPRIPPPWEVLPGDIADSLQQLCRYAGLAPPHHASFQGGVPHGGLNYE